MFNILIIQFFSTNAYQECNFIEALNLTTDNKDFAISIMTQNGYALRCVSDILKKDKEIVLAAITQNGYALYYADESLKKTKTLY